jgi:lycopene cyclase domain-containing protein
MKEYTFLAIASALAVFVLDHWLRTGVFRKKNFWIALGVMFLFKLPSNGYLTGRPIVLYNSQEFLGIRIGTIPLEDFFYGFGLITITIVLWEYFLRKEKAS